MTMSVPQRILIAPSGFKGSLEADVVAESIASGIRRVIPGVNTVTMPIPDGGEGTAKMLVGSTGGTLVHAKVTGPVGQQVRSHYALLGGDQEGVAVVEMAAAAGLSLVPKDLRNPAETTTYGVGQLISAALDNDRVHTILVGCGDSGTSDGGAGALSALGARILNDQGEEIPLGGAHLTEAASIDYSGLHPRLGQVRIVLALNQHNILTGPKGVARVFGPQKGATPEQVDQLDAALTHWADLLEKTYEEKTGGKLNMNFHSGPGTGASGGLGAGMAFIGAELTPRFEALIDSGLAGINLDREIQHADLVVTAEGAIDFQTPKGKVPAEIAARAQKTGAPVLALAGSIGRKAYRVHDAGIDAFASIIPLPMDLEDALVNGEALLTDSAERTFRMILLGASLSASMQTRRTMNAQAA
ncbi:MULTISPECIES: glycerate kinase [Rothia]|uniref:Glycerate kinase n=1 Tax=Rothia nasimurium TaxID=85336 RepID=A0A1Y1RSF6_9MICC|nr:MULTISPECIES: glycerate kinase [Rothia]ORC22557.1 glycerate kinase [Rothia nasimurium]